MLDIQFIRDNPDLVREKAKQKGYEVDIQEVLKCDESRRSLLQKIEDLRRERNDLTDKAKGSKPSQEDIEAGRKLKEELGQLEATLNETEQSFNKLIRAIPNPAADDVPVGDYEASKEVSKFGEQTKGGEDHLDFATRRGWLDFERGAKVAGTKYYFLKGDLALLENALIQFVLDYILKQGFTFMSVPHMVNSRVATGAGFAPRSSEQSDEYFIEGEDLSLIATAEMPLTGYHADEIIDEKDLPLLYVALSPCYRKEAGTYGKHTRGLFRVHQFNKLEMYAFTAPEKSLEMHEKIRALEEDIWQALGIPYRVVNIASGDLGAPAAKKYDLEYWSPVDGNYRELTSCSNCTDFQTRNLNIRLRRVDGTIEALHSLNGTATATARSLVAIMEHYQTKEGKLRVPKVLQPYMGGKEEI